MEDGPVTHLFGPVLATKYLFRTTVLLMRVDREYVFSAVANERRQIAALIDQLDDA
ncbi:hypothetical protein MLAC_07310 [Mycobacterium lacus]|uniref:Uncharacterized protein n=1 Tax=Mycobacterium lacus TaxID=169765 RepID=A0A7I7NIV8_9MYCO|nr:hypothetical protein MLAC_07310 [Mycobacterium lacus]